MKAKRCLQRFCIAPFVGAGLPVFGPRKYTAFLNSVAATATHGLYSLEMGDNIHELITRAGNEGEFTYAVNEGFGNKPVNSSRWVIILR